MPDVEPIEVSRRYDTGQEKERSSVGFVDASEFVSNRIYVNGAWGTNFDHGYEIPLWNRRDTSGFYPKPLLALRVRASGERNLTHPRRRRSGHTGS